MGGLPDTIESLTFSKAREFISCNTGGPVMRCTKSVTVEQSCDGGEAEQILKLLSLQYPNIQTLTLSFPLMERHIEPLRGLTSLENLFMSYETDVNLLQREVFQLPNISYVCVGKTMYII